jgi:uncharacterized Rmd1/YagE family protein
MRFKSCLNTKPSVSSFRQFLRSPVLYHAQSSFVSSLLTPRRYFANPTALKGAKNHKKRSFGEAYPYPVAKAVCVAEFFNKNKLLSHLSANYPVTEKAVTQMMTSCYTFQSSQTAVFHVPLSSNQASEDMKNALVSAEAPPEGQQPLATLIQPDMFIFFDYGCVVFWGVAADHEARILKELLPFAEERWPDADIDSETINFFPGSPSDHVTAVDVDYDLLTFSHDGTDTSILSEKLVASQTLMKSALLDVFVNRAETQIQSLQQITNQLAIDGSFSKHMSWIFRRRLRIMVGRLLQLRGMVNLHSDILDEPNFVREAHSQLYHQLWRNFSMESRISLLNKRLDYANEVTHVLEETSSHNQTLLIEILIVLLIFIEVYPILVDFFFYVAETQGWIENGHVNQSTKTIEEAKPKTEGPASTSKH